MCLSCLAAGHRQRKVYELVIAIFFCPCLRHFLFFEHFTVSRHLALLIIVQYERKISMHCLELQMVLLSIVFGVAVSTLQQLFKNLF